MSQNGSGQKKLPDAPEPAGFGNCGQCAYAGTGPIALCSKCAQATLSPPSQHRCPICDQTLASATASCINNLCNSSDRRFESVTAIAMKTGELQDAILRVKDHGKWAWGYIFARVVLGYLYEHPEVIDGVDAIIPMPAYLESGEDFRVKDHAGWVIQQADEQDERALPFVYDPPAIVKTKATPKMRLTTSATERRAAAQELYDALVVPDLELVRGRSFLVYDDVFTGGNTLNAVARRLKDSGASAVYGLALARARWRL